MSIHKRKRVFKLVVDPDCEDFEDFASFVTASIEVPWLKGLVVNRGDTPHSGEIKWCLGGGKSLTDLQKDALVAEALYHAAATWNSSLRHSWSNWTLRSLQNKSYHRLSG